MNLDIIRAWKDAHYRKSLNAEEQALLPENPVGQIDLTETDLRDIIGAAGGYPSEDLECYTWDFDCTYPEGGCTGDLFCRE